MAFSIEKLATFLFACALVHSFCVSFISRFSRNFAEGTFLAKFFHFLSEVEIVFAIWAMIFLFVYSIHSGPSEVFGYIRSLSFAEPAFVFCVMLLASSRPLVVASKTVLLKISEYSHRVTKIDIKLIQVFIVLSLGPLLGSFITEPAAITLVALLLYRMIGSVELKLLYGLLALLFVNISIGGGLTPFAAPPIVIVAHTWNWGFKDIFINLGEPVLLAVFVNASLFVFYFKDSIKTQMIALEKDHFPMPVWLVGIHILMLIGMVYFSHEQSVFIQILFIFVALTWFTKKLQDELKYRQSFLVALFLAGLIVFGAFQQWWLKPVITSLSDAALYFSATALTGITDNAALTYLGSQVSTLSESAKWALVSGAISGGGLSILANAPNPAGFSILGPKFPGNTLHAGKLLIAALPPTVIVIISFLLLGNF